MSAQGTGAKTQIIIAIIGLIGVLFGALFANWDKIFPTDVQVKEQTKQLVDLSISTTYSYDNPNVRLAPQDPGKRVVYQVGEQDGVLKFYPRLPFVTFTSKTSRHIDLSILDTFYLRHAFPFPTLDVKLLNESTSTLLVTKVVIDVLDASIDDSPLLHSIDGGDEFIRIMNYGWGPALNVEIDGVIESKEGDIPFRHSIPRIEGGDVWMADIAQFLLMVHQESHTARSVVFRQYSEADQFEEDFFAKFTRLAPLAERHGNNLKIRTQLSYDGTDLIHTVANGDSWISLGFPPTGAYGGSSQSYSLDLAVKDGIVRKVIPVSHVVKGGEADRFKLVIYPQESAFYKCRLAVFAGDEEITAFDFELEVFRPRVPVDASMTKGDIEKSGTIN